MNWADGEAFAPKLERLLTLIDDVAKKGPVSLVAASAGATAAINAYAARLDVISGLVCICGKINNPEGIAAHYVRDNPAFGESAAQTVAALSNLNLAQRQHILSIRAMFDPVVSAKDSILEGAYNRATWTSGHALTIATQLLFGAPSFIRFLKRQTQS